MTKVLILLAVLIIFAFISWELRDGSKTEILTPKHGQVLKVEKPLDKYSYNRLRQMNFESSDITIGEVVKDEADFKSSMFYFNVDGKRVSGLINVPEESGNYPVIVMFRGYVDREQYTTGVGTARMGEYLAKGGFISLAPDFLGYGASDNPSQNPLEERFQTYVTAITLINSVKNLNSSLALLALGIRTDSSKVGIWGHSNGGQVALSILAVTGATLPTVLWAPVSKPFPYSILYYTDDFDDHGKMLRRVVADFEKDYDSEKYSLTNFLDLINAPIQLHQGGQDEAVPINWSNKLFDSLKKIDQEIEYFTYPAEDHNFSGGNWPLVAWRSLEFYRNNFAK